MTTTDLAAALLRNVRRHYDANAERVMLETEVLAALTAALDPAIAERAGDALERLRWHREHPVTGKLVYANEDGPDAADLITALIAQNGAMRAERDELRAAIFGSPDYDPALRNGNFREMAETLHASRAGGVARAEAAEAKVEKLRGALMVARAHVANNAEGWSVSRGAARDDLTIVDAALTTKADPAEVFNKADWFWRTMDPEDCGDTPEEAINRAMLGRFCVCEIASSYSGPTRYGFIAPVLGPESDDEEFVHFATQQEAIDAAKIRAAITKEKSND